MRNLIRNSSSQVLVGDNDAKTAIKSTLKHCQTVRGGIEIENSQIDRYNQQVGTKIDEYTEVLQGIDRQLNKINSLQQLIDYTSVLREIEDIRYNVRISIK